jgi:NADH-quinone oxidoreductase subunit D
MVGGRRQASLVLSGVNLGLEVGLGDSREKFTSMEALISHFCLASGGYVLATGVTYRAVESPKGEVGVSLVSGGGTKPLRVKLRTPVSHNMHMLPTVGVGATFSDFIATFCSFDIVMGEIDR